MFMSCKKIKELELSGAGGIGYTYKCMGAGFWALKQDNFKKAMIQVVMQAGDADTNGCVAGAMLACKLGLSAIPKDWIDELEHKDWLMEYFHRFVRLQSELSKPVSERTSNDDLSLEALRELTQKIRDGDGQEPVTKKKLTVQDLLRQCDHYGSSARVNAIAGLKELWLSNHQEFMQPSNKHGYGSILQKISTMFIDNEAVVRHSVISLFKLIIKRISVGQSQPPKGFPMLHIHTYLCCGLNHVHEDIKLDSLLIFDVLLDALPNLLIEQTGDLLNNLLGFISAPISIGARADSTTQRLSLNPDSKLPVMLFRSRVLLRIKRLFETAVNAKTEQQGDTPDIVDQEPLKVWSLGEDHNGENTRQDTMVQSQQTRGKFQSLFSGACHELNSYLTKPSTLEYFVTHSITVLLQCWKEARASVDSQPQSGGVLPRDAAEVMSLVVTIIQLAFNLCGVKRLKTKCSNSNSDTLVSADILVASRAVEFEKLFMNSFPFSVQVQAPTGKKRKRKHPDSEKQTPPISMDNLNLGLCDIMSCFLTCPSFKLEWKWCAKLQDFIKENLKKSPSGEHCSMIARFLNNIIQAPSVVEMFLPSLKAAFHFFNSCSVMSAQKKMMYSVFETLCKAWDGQKGDDGSWTSSVSQLVVEFYSKLPQLLLHVIKKKGDGEWALQVVLLMTKARAQNCAEFTEKLLQVLPQYLDSDNGILGCGRERVIQQLFFILSMGIPFSKQHYKQVLQALRQPPEKPLLPRRRSCSLVSHVIQSLYQNIHHIVPLTNQVDFNKSTAEQQSYLSEFLSFMLSLQIGMLKEMLDECSPVGDVGPEGVKLWQFNFCAETEQWERHLEISQLVARELVNFYIPAFPEEGYNDSFSFTNSVSQLWMKAFAGRNKMPVLTAYSLVVYVSLLSGKHVRGQPGPDFLGFAACVMASILVHVHERDNASNPDLKQMTWAMKDRLVLCLQQNQQLLELAWVSLCEISQKPKDAESAATAKEFLLSDATLKQGIEEVQSRLGNK
ncbi:uncharacterized protein LOC101848559 [Aplysia californica]|uniref:Uncharacterized protein LOC101848559 n=1 Tax=Aplysia californica TaxID=6500 RepID=A0ABM1A7Y1_APLCA|nr:uncharacterized protein LOC101848559 [Aplysia californica]